MEIKLPEIQTIIDELKNDSQAMANEQVRTAVEQLDEMLDQLDLKQKVAAPDKVLDAQASIRQVETLMSLLPQISEAISQQEPLLRLLLQAAVTCRRMGETEHTTRYCEQLLNLTADNGYPQIRAEALMQLGHLQFQQGQWSRAQVYYQQSLTLFEAEDDSGGVAKAYNRLGDISSQQGDYELAKNYYQQVIDIAQQEDAHQRLLASAYRSLGIIAMQQNDWDAAIDHCEKSIGIYESVELPGEAAGVLMNLAMAYVDCEEWEAAGECYAESTELAEKSGNLYLLSQIYINRAEFLLNMASIDAAQLYCDKALANFQKSSDKIGIHICNP